MSQTRTNFIPQKRHSFICQNCGKENEDNLPSPRNHCKYCLYSLHVDQSIPGDRLSNCKGVMKPVGIDYHAKKGYMILHRCQTCQKEIKNKAAQDDNYDLIVKLSTQHD